MHLAAFAAFGQAIMNEGICLQNRTTPDAANLEEDVASGFGCGLPTVNSCQKAVYRYLWRRAVLCGSLMKLILLWPETMAFLGERFRGIGSVVRKTEVLVSFQERNETIRSTTHRAWRWFLIIKWISKPQFILLCKITRWKIIFSHCIQMPIVTRLFAIEEANRGLIHVRTFACTYPP